MSIDLICTPEVRVWGGRRPRPRCKAELGFKVTLDIEALTKYSAHCTGSVQTSGSFKRYRGQIQRNAEDLGQEQKLKRLYGLGFV